MRALVLIAACAALMAGCSREPAAPAAPPAAAAPTPSLAPTSLSAFFDCLQRENATLVAAHRGGDAPGYAENALATFAHTVAQAPVALEIDVRRTKDGVLVLMHDDTLERTTTGTGPVYAVTAAEFAALRLKDEAGAVLAAGPPTLVEALAWSADKTILELDVKPGVPIGEVVAAVRAANAGNRVIIITYTIADAIGAHRADPALMISTSIDGEADLDRLERAGVDLSRVLAWTGVSEPNANLNVVLAQRGVESLFGTLGDADSWDAKFARGEGGGYAAFAETGIELIASDRPVAAQRALDAADGEGYAPLRCVGAG